MKIIIITGSFGLIGSEAVSFFSKKFDIVIGIDNNMREYFFGKDASVLKNEKLLKEKYNNYIHFNTDIRNKIELEKIFKEYNTDIKLIIHTAAQPSHDWAVKEPFTDFSINAIGTLNLLELTRQYCTKSVFIYTSTNKVYGDNPNYLPLVELQNRWEIDSKHKYSLNGIDETMSIDYTKHSLFGVSKLSADLLCQEYGKYFNMNVGIFRCGCLTGENHQGVQLHGFISYFLKCAINNQKYNIYGYKGKQVRDNIHSFDLITAFWHFYNNPLLGEVFNMGGGRNNSTSILELIEILKNDFNINMNFNYVDIPRIGDHIWYISDFNKFQSIYPNWKLTYNLKDIIKNMIK
jgi:CDP-paratose 2-epimerase